jgi:hypothetical protein
MTYQKGGFRAALFSLNESLRGCKERAEPPKSVKGLLVSGQVVFRCFLLYCHPQGDNFLHVAVLVNGLAIFIRNRVGFKAHRFVAYATKQA